MKSRSLRCQTSSRVPARASSSACGHDTPAGCVDRIWQEVVDRETFKMLKFNSLEVLLFEAICSGCRRHLLKYRLYLELEVGCTAEATDLSPETGSAAAHNVVHESFSKLSSALQAFEPSHQYNPPCIHLRFTFRGAGCGWDFYDQCLPIGSLPVVTVICSVGMNT